jgi:hypothetical protein
MVTSEREFRIGLEQWKDEMDARDSESGTRYPSQFYDHATEQTGDANNEN